VFVTFVVFLVFFYRDEMQPNSAALTELGSMLGYL